MAAKTSQAPLTIFTIGHSTRALHEFIHLLQSHGITRVADIRTIPRSRRNPQFNQDTLPAALQATGIGYIHLPGLGGLRHARTDSPNTAWHNASFRGFADYMQSAEFAGNIEQLIDLAQSEQLALMCAEAVPWRCHRSLVADALSVRGIAVKHIISTSQGLPHRLTPWAQVKGNQVLYPAPAP